MVWVSLAESAPFWVQVRYGSFLHFLFINRLLLGNQTRNVRSHFWGCYGSKTATKIVRRGLLIISVQWTQVVAGRNPELASVKLSFSINSLRTGLAGFEVPVQV